MAALSARRVTAAGAGNTVWLASYPKSGNTWFRAVASAWRTGDPWAMHEASQRTVGRYNVGETLGLDPGDLTDAEAAALRPLVDEVIDGDQSTPHLQKIHDALWHEPSGPLMADEGSDGPRPVVSLRATRCAIYLLRDPRDVAVSLAHHTDRDAAWAAGELCSPDAFLGRPRDDIGPQVAQRLGRWDDHVRGWVDDAPFPVLAVRYEDLLDDPLRWFGAAFTHAGFDATDQALAAAIEAAAFTRLQELEREEGFRERVGRRSPFFRRGVAGGWRDELAPDLAARIEAELGETMVRFGYLPATEPAERPDRAD